MLGMYEVTAPKKKTTQFSGETRLVTSASFWVAGPRNVHLPSGLYRSSVQPSDLICDFAGGIVDGAMYTKEGLLHLAALPSLDDLQGQTAATLNAAVGNMANLLSSHQQQLASNLEQYLKDQTGNSSAAGSALSEAAGAS